MALVQQLDALRPLLDAGNASQLVLLRRVGDLLEALRAFEASGDASGVKRCLLAAMQGADASLAVAALFIAVPVLETRGGLLDWEEVHSLMAAVHGGGEGGMQQSVKLALVRSLARAAC